MYAWYHATSLIPRGPSIISFKLSNVLLTLEQSLPVMCVVDQLCLLTSTWHFFVEVELEALLLSFIAHGQPYVGFVRNHLDANASVVVESMGKSSGLARYVHLLQDASYHVKIPFRWS